MTKPAVTYPDPHVVLVDFLTDAMAAFDGDTPTVGATLPTDWTPRTSPAHLLVASDGVPDHHHPVVIWPTVRLVGWSNDPVLSSRLVQFAQGHVCAHVGGDFSATYLTGPLPARDPDHDNAELASTTVRVALRSTPIT